MKFLKKIIVIILLVIVYIYVCNIELMPSRIICFEGDKVDIKTIVGVKLKRGNNAFGQIIQTSSNVKNPSNIFDKTGSFELNLNLFGTIPVKQINVNVIPKTSVVPLGNLIGVKLYSSGVLVVGMSEIQGCDLKKYQPYLNSGIEEGDVIVELNNKKIAATEDLINIVNKSKGKEIKVKFIRDKQEKETCITPVKSLDSRYKLGLWVRDATAGVGTLTFYEPSTGNFAALGHGITDIDTGKIFDIANGELVTTNLLSIERGKSGVPGELKGTIDGAKTIGDISKNTNFGIFGLVKNKENIDTIEKKAYEVASRNEIKNGKAEIICELEEGKLEKYNIEISKIYSSNNYDNKSMQIKIKDDRLIDKTGGIIQGMSGSPIIQNGKFIGAVTNVLVSDPTTGYAIFGDLMVKQMKSIK